MVCYVPKLRLNMRNGITEVSESFDLLVIFSMHRHHVIHRHITFRVNRNVTAAIVIERVTFEAAPPRWSSGYGTRLLTHRSQD